MAVFFNSYDFPEKINIVRIKYVLVTWPLCDPRRNRDPFRLRPFNQGRRGDPKRVLKKGRKTGKRFVFAELLRVNYKTYFFKNNTD